jgi:ribosomal protein S10
MNITILSRHLGRLSACLSKCVSLEAYKTMSRRVLSTPSQWHGQWEPNDVKLEPDVPEFKELHIKLKGYDCPTLESYAKYVHRVARVVFHLETDTWASPAKCLQAKTFHPKSVNVNQKYDLQIFDRTVSAQNVPLTTVPLLLQFIHKNCPEGVEVSLKEPDPEEEEYRYVPDYEVLELQAQKEFIASGKLKKK